VSKSAQEILEFERLREIVRRHTTCAPGRREVEALEFSVDRAELEAAFALIEEAIAYLRAGGEMGFGALADPGPWLERLNVPGAVLAPAELLDASSLVETAGELKKAFRHEAAKHPRLSERAGSLPELGGLAKTIRRAILPNGEISDDASPELKRIRGTIGKTREKLLQDLKRIIRGRGEEPGEDYVTLRNDRFVIPVRAAERRSVPGVVHGASSTGQTVFVEPLETLETNNQLVQLAEDEAAEIARILDELTGRLRAERPALAAAAETIALVDSIFARARFSREFNCCVPAFVEVARLRLDAARHPVLEDKLRKQERSVVPLSLELGGADTVLVVSGPNTGGKTVALKTVGLAVLAAQSGIPVAAERAELPLVDHLLADIGDEQSIAADLSTFSAHMLNLRGMLAAATPRSLVLVDELGTGTAPEEGSALAVALLEEFRGRGCLTMATTHHDKLKAYASTTPGVLNSAMEFDGEHLKPTYRLLTGVPGVSCGIAIAERLGMPATAIARAKKELDPDVREAAELIAYLHRSRDEMESLKRQAGVEIERLEAERVALRTEWAERQRKRLAELEARFNETLKSYEQQMARVVEGVKDRELRAQLEKQTKRQSLKARGEAREESNSVVVEHLADSQQDLGTAGAPVIEPVTPEKLVLGARLRVRGLPQPVVLRRRDERSAEVQAGPLRMKIKLDDILAVVTDAAPVSRGAAMPAGSRPGINVRSAAGGAAAEEINVIGCTVEEASERVDKFLDEAALASKPRVRIIHGHGTGALRRGLAEFLATHPQVEKIYADDPEHGGSAVTVVELKA
jgi:DNA mismatch repair protein MutS2